MIFATVPSRYWMCKVAETCTQGTEDNEIFYHECTWPGRYVDEKASKKLGRLRCLLLTDMCWNSSPSARIMFRLKRFVVCCRKPRKKKKQMKRKKETEEFSSLQNLSLSFSLSHFHIPLDFFASLCLPFTVALSIIGQALNRPYTIILNFPRYGCFFRSIFGYFSTRCRSWCFSEMRISHPHQGRISAKRR